MSSRFAKQAEPDAAWLKSLMEGLKNNANAGLRRDALKDIGWLGLGSLGVASAARGAMGLNSLLRDHSTNKELRQGPVELAFPLPEKQADLAEFSRRLLQGAEASTKGGIPWYWPGMAAAGLTGAELGWHGAGALMQSRRESEREDTLAKHRKAFQEALMAQHEPEDKQAADATWRETGRELARQFELLSKQADLAEMASNGLGKLLGAYGAYSAMVGIPSAIAGYNYYQKHSQRALIEKALRARKRQQAAQSPPEIYAMPVPYETATKAAAAFAK